MTPAPIRLARPDEVARILEVEDLAGERFADAGLPPDLEGLGEAIVEAGIREGLLWVLPDAGDVVIGFALAWLRPGALHLRELDVVPAWMGRGHGRALIDHVCTQARQRGLPRVTLTTFADVPWNRPLYVRCGFHVMQPDDQPPWLADIRAAERRAGLDRWPRVAMARDLA